MTKPDERTLDEIGRVMHETWNATKRAQGFHGPREHSIGAFLCNQQECPKFHADLIPWEQLPEKQKDINRHAADALIERGILVPRAEADAAVAAALEQAAQAADDAVRQYLQKESLELPNPSPQWSLLAAGAKDAARSVRSLATQPQRDALAEHDRQVRMEEVERCYTNWSVYESARDFGRWLNNRISALRGDKGDER